MVYSRSRKRSAKACMQSLLPRHSLCIRREAAGTHAHATGRSHNSHAQKCSGYREKCNMIKNIFMHMLWCAGLVALQLVVRRCFGQFVCVFTDTNKNTTAGCDALMRKLASISLAHCDQRVWFKVYSIMVKLLDFFVSLPTTITHQICRPVQLNRYDMVILCMQVSILGPNVQRH